MVVISMLKINEPSCIGLYFSALYLLNELFFKHIDIGQYMENINTISILQRYRENLKRHIDLKDLPKERSPIFMLPLTNEVK